MLLHCPILSLWSPLLSLGYVTGGSEIKQTLYRMSKNTGARRIKGTGENLQEPNSENPHQTQFLLHWHLQPHHRRQRYQKDTNIRDDVENRGSLLELQISEILSGDVLS